jgi:hypothetical protein
MYWFVIQEVGILTGGFWTVLRKRLELLFRRSKLGVCFGCLHKITENPQVKIIYYNFNKLRE